MLDMIAVLIPVENGLGTIYGLGTFNITTHAELNCWLKDVWFPRSSYEEREQILKYYPEDPSQGVRFTGIEAEALLCRS